MKNNGAFRDILLGLLALPAGLALVWAGNNNALDVAVVLLLLMVPLTSLYFVAKNWPKPDFDN